MKELCAIVAVVAGVFVVWLSILALSRQHWPEVVCVAIHPAGLQIGMFGRTYWERDTSGPWITKFTPDPRLKPCQYTYSLADYM